MRSTTLSICEHYRLKVKSDILTPMAKTEVQRSGRAALMAAAEQLIALRGVHVPLRDIAIAAGHRNNSAVQYHFTSREDLVTAVIEHRAPTLEAHRLEHLVAVERDGLADDAPPLVGALVRPLLEAPLVDGDWYYARFLEQVRVLPAAIGAATLAQHRGSVALILSRLRSLLLAPSNAPWQLRMDLFGSALFAMAADHERRLEAGIKDRERVAAEQAIVEALTAVLRAG
jgi:AcrR family transcriptional regulator